MLSELMKSIQFLRAKLSPTHAASVLQSLHPLVHSSDASEERKEKSLSLGHSRFWKSVCVYVHGKMRERERE